ncbi:transmembrane 220 family protein [Neolewinella lacunae]|uniref:Transmembrane 220 family protein n=1 Tax=Neolewinella lacunae TaxID=1517758 RepID=A0A923PKZ4_9BACT|nr:transmembrane 220 family protein [Neolewinella lacunae]MBC6994626.1 transmembrane 220 family protein [Neolewinella lacunae]MDN3634498.1 transmembrane 220 family protein [Neolewinella lacunae]
MKFLHLGVAALFLLCAYWQLNDPDWNRWVAAYGIVAFVAVRAFTGGLRPVVALLPAVALFAWWCAYLPDFTQWLRDGTPTITGSMQAESPYIELTREFFGLLICWVTLAAYAIWARRR